ncbi:hypothetical protein [uncultured Tateyamaria sp.]|uniref:hypothetical protein n=1 Tax=uncultured Tateyamaria sp. TaxID=455651 RepID=UPI00260F9055|nr:hypothetical protein [uncultured Tateyamaria sp.]
MFKFILKSTAMVATVGMVMGLAAPASAAVVKPPVSYQGQWWVHPLGCEYSRAGRPGETMWFLIINTRKKGCPSYIAGTTWGGIYRAEGSKM